MEGLNGDLGCLSETSVLDDVGYCDGLVGGEKLLVSLNVRSIIANKFKLEDSILKHQPKIVALQEVWQADNVNLRFENYHFEFETRVGRRGGGVGLLVHKSLLYSKRKDLSFVSNDIEMIAIETEKKLNFLCVHTAYSKYSHNDK